MPLTVSDGLRSGECDAQPSVPDSRCRRAVGAAAVTKGAAEVPHVVSGLHTVPGPAERAREEEQQGPRHRSKPRVTKRNVNTK